MQDDYDSPWKEAIERHFPDFMHFYFPDAHACIDWQQPPVFLDQELRAVVQDARVGKRFVDKLVRVASVGGAIEWIYVHIEVQGEPQPEFAERMFVYHYRLYDRYKKPIASLAVLSDDRTSWRPESFHYSSLGCHLDLSFPVAKLLDWAGKEAMLDDSRNPFAVVTQAHLATRRTRGDASARYAVKWRLVQGLYRRGFVKQQVLDLFRVIDWLMRLPQALDAQLRHDLHALEEEAKMQYISSIERLAIDEGMRKGMQQGMQQGMEQGRLDGKVQSLMRLLALRFGDLPAWAGERIAHADETALDAWTAAVLSAGTLAAVFASDQV